MSVHLDPDEVGGVHAKYLAHCPRQLWLYVHGIRPEHRSDTVAAGQVVADTTYTRHADVDLDTIVIDWIDADGNPHEVKSSLRHQSGHDDQALLYLRRLNDLGLPADQAVLHYPRTRRTRTVTWDDTASRAVDNFIERVVAVCAAPEPPGRLARPACRGCAYTDLCWV